MNVFFLWDRFWGKPRRHHRLSEKHLSLFSYNFNTEQLVELVRFLRSYSPSHVIAA